MRKQRVFDNAGDFNAYQISKEMKRFVKSIKKIKTWHKRVTGATFSYRDWAGELVYASFDFNPLTFEGKVEVNLQHEWDHGCVNHYTVKGIEDIVFMAELVASSMTLQDVYEGWTESGRKY